MLDERQDPLMVELDAGTPSLAPKIVGQPFTKTTFELFFAVNEPNLESVEVVVRKNGDDRTVIPEEVVDSSRPQALQDGDIGRVFKAQYTISDFRAFHDIEVFVKTVDLFGQENEISVANYSSLNQGDHRVVEFCHGPPSGLTRCSSHHHRLPVFGFVVLQDLRTWLFPLASCY